MASLVVGSSAPARAVESFHTGSEALGLCQQDGSWCIGLVAGFAEAMLRAERAGKGAEEICFGEEVDTIKIRDMLVAYLEAHPEDGSRPVGDSLHRAMANAYPCST